MWAAPAAKEALPERVDLEQALSFALEHNFTIRGARERLREQEGVVTTVSAAALPAVSASGSFQKSNVQSFQAPSAQNPGVPVIVPSGRYWRMNFTVRQTLYAGGGIRAAMDSAGFTRDAAMLELQAVINETLLAVRTRFYAALLARAQITVQEQNLQLLESQVQDVTIRVQAGAVSEFERLRAEVAVANARVPLIKARNDHRLAVEELRQILGLGFSDKAAPGEATEFVGVLAFAPVNFDLREALQTARASRPELQRLARLVAAAKAGEQTARAGLYPTLTLTGGGELRKGPSEKFSDSLRGLRAGVQAQESVNLRATTGRVRQAESGTELARLEAGAAELAVQVEVRQAVSTLEQAAELVAASRKSVEQAEEAVRIATVRFKAGMTPQLDLLQAQVELTRARTNQLQAVYAHNVALARLRKAIGQSDLRYTNDNARTAQS
jgi:outer membrane protein TolC